MVTALHGKLLIKVGDKPLGFIFCSNLRKEVFTMCYFQGQSVGEYCSCCQKCSMYLVVCIPIVSYGFAVGECDFDFCCYCPNYGECEEVWGKAVSE